MSITLVEFIKKGRGEGRILLLRILSRAVHEMGALWRLDLAQGRHQYDSQKRKAQDVRGI